MKLLKELLASKIWVRTVLKILRNSSFRSHWKHDQRRQQVSLCLILIYRRFSVQFVTTTSQFTLSESNGLVYKPHPRFLAQNLSKKVWLIHKSLRYFPQFNLSFEKKPLFAKMPKHHPKIYTKSSGYGCNDRDLVLLKTWPRYWQKDCVKRRQNNLHMYIYSRLNP